MARRRIFWQLMPPYLLITLIALFAVTWYARSASRDFYISETRSDLEARAQIFERLVLQHMDPLNRDFIANLCTETGSNAATRLTVVLTNGDVIGDSHENPIMMENHVAREEIATALQGEVASSSRFSHTLQANLMYVAVPMRANGEVIGVVRTSVPLTSIEEAVQTISLKIMVGGFFIALIAALLTLTSARNVSRPLESMTTAAESFARGDFSRRVPKQDAEELNRLADAMNWMASQLDEKIGTVQRQRNEQDAVLSSMVEGVLAIDAEERIIDMNIAAYRLLCLKPDNSIKGRSIQEIVRNPDLHQLISKTLKSDTPIEEDIVITRDGEERYVQVVGTTLRDPGETAFGALIVLHDVSRIMRLERVRRDFVANVSHELKTPITSIKGFVETLQDGAIDEPESSKKFLAIVAKQADRLTTIIEDLLSLSRIEQERERGLNDTMETDLKRLVDSAIEICQQKAEAKNMQIRFDMTERIRADVKGPLLEQAVANLIDNAIKYSEPGNPIDIDVRKDKGELQIAVRDRGCGIPNEHLARLFERFYRVDKARSRELGGTGLGLAIVKHIAIAHRGSVHVESKMGEGSTFTIRIPVEPVGATV